MGWNLRVVVAVVVLLLALAAEGVAQIPTATAVELQQMASHAGVIFTGEVVAVTRRDAVGYVDIRFHIADGIRGCPQTGFYVLREWSGLWTGQPERYRVGQRRLMLLQARGAAGMSSPVGGMDGAIPLVPSGVAPIADVAGNAPADAVLAPADFSGDLRWIVARAQRTTVSGVARSRMASGNPAMPWPDPPSADWPGPIAPIAPAVVVSGKATLGSILTLLRGPQARSGSGVDVSLGGATGAVGLGACRWNSPQCRWATDSNGIISTTVMPLQPGLITLNAIYLSVVASASFTAVGMGRTMTVLTQPPATVQVGDKVNFAVQVLTPGGTIPMTGDPLLYSIVGGPFGFTDWSTTDVTRMTDGNGDSFEVGVATAAGAITVLASDGVVSQTFQFTAIARPDIVTILSAPASGSFSGAPANSPLTAKVLLQDGVTSAVNRTVTISVTTGAASFAACAGAATCQLVTDAQGTVTTAVTPLSSGTITLTVSEGGVSQTVHFTAVAPVLPPQLSLSALGTATYIAAGATISYGLNVVALYNGLPAVAQGIQWSLSSGFATATTHTVTNSAGTASDLVFLGPLAPGGDAIATACAWGNVCARFDGFSVAPADEAITIVSGTQQSILGGAALAPVVAMVADAGGHPVAAAPVSVYQTVTAFDAACPDRGRCPAAAVLATQATVEVSAIDGTIRIAPLVVSGKATKTEIAFTAGTQGFATVVATAQP